MLKKLIIIYGLLLLAADSVNAEQNWSSWYKPPTVLSIAFEDNFIWCGLEDGGVISYNKVTEEQQRYTAEDGLIHNIVYCIAVDYNGTKWFGTKEGVSQFDGNNWTSHPINQENYPYGSKINDIAVDQHNKIWAVTSKGIYNYDGTRWQTAQSGYYNCIEIDNSGIIWAGDSQYFLRLEDTEATILGSDVPDVSVGQVKDIIYETYTGTILCAVHRGFVTYDDAVDSLTVFPSLSSYNVITTDNKGTIWLGNDEGLTSINEDKTTRYTERDGLPSNSIKALTFDNDGTLWIGDRQGLSSYDGESFRLHLGPYASHIASIVIDNENTVWCTHETNRSESSFFREGKWSIGPQGMRKVHVVDENNILWGTHFSSLFAYDGIELTYHNIRAPLPGFNCDTSDLGDIRDIHLEGNGTIWIASMGGTGDCTRGGIFTYDGDIVVPKILGIFTSVTIDSKKNVWCVVFDGDLYKNNGNEWIQYTELDGLPKNLIANVEIDKNDVVWSGVIHGDYYSLMSYDGESFDEYIPENSDLLSADFNFLAIDHNNTKWIGTDAGVCRFDGETWITFNTKNSGLCDNKVNAIAVEKNNTIWFGTDNGVSRYTGEVITTSVDEEDETPEALPVINSYPNPFNPSTTIEFTLPESGFTTLAIYNIYGQKVRELAAEYMTAGAHSLMWDGRDDNGNAVSSGVYITRLMAGKQVAAGRMILLK